MRAGVVARSVVVSLVLLFAVAVAACGESTVESDVVTASGGSTTKTYALSGFTAVHADQDFSVAVTRGESFAVSVSAEESLIQYLTVEVRGDALYLGLDPSRTYRLASLTAEVTMPELSGVQVTGAADVFVEGFTTEEALTFTVADAGRLDIDALKAQDATFELSGASRLGGKLALAGALSVIARGGSQAVLAGVARTVDVQASEASLVSLQRVAARTATVELTGGSKASVRAGRTVNASLSEASAMDYYGTAELGEMDVAGMSQVQHIQ